MGRRAEAVDPEAAAFRQARPAQGSIADDPRAEQGRGLLVVEGVGQPVGVVLVDDRVFGVATVVVPTREARAQAEVLVTTTAEPAHTAGVAEPGDPGTFAGSEAGCSLSDGVDHTD